jgi:precorrin-6B methylase 1
LKRCSHRPQNGGRGKYNCPSFFEQNIFSEKFEMKNILKIFHSTHSQPHTLQRNSIVLQERMILKTDSITGLSQITGKVYAIEEGHDDKITVVEILPIILS